MKCALTGHRAVGKDLTRAALEKTLRELAEKGTDTFFCGMAVGFDMLCCKILLSLREELPLRVVACVPCANQSERFSSDQKRLYERLLAACDEKIVLHERYTEGCMFERNRYMVDACDFLLAYLRTQKGGTFYTVNYAKKKGKSILFV